MMKSNVQLVASTSFVSSYLTPFFENGNGLILGLAICGSLVYVMNAKELSIFSRMVYVFIAAFIGYAMATSFASTETIRGVIAFMASAGVIAITIQVLQFIRTEHFVKDTIQLFLKLFGRDK